MENIEDYMDHSGEENFSMTLEHLKMDAVEVTRNTHATSYWDNALYGQCFGNLWHHRIQPALLNALNNNRYLRGSGKVPTMYLGNHDHSHVTWQAGARNNAGALEALRGQVEFLDETQVLVVQVPDRVGALNEIAQKLADAEISIQWACATTTGGAAAIVFSTSDNAKAAGLV